MFYIYIRKYINFNNKNEQKTCKLLLSIPFLDSSNNVWGDILINSINRLNCNFNMSTDPVVTELIAQRE